MKKLNLHDMYMLGKRLNALTTLTDDQPLKSKVFDLFWAMTALSEAIKPESPLLDAARRAATDLRNEINAALPEKFDDAINAEDPIGYRAFGIARKLEALESVLANEMPGCSTFIASQKGIYRTEDLIERAELQFPAEISHQLPEQARADLREAGKALAFQLPTACCFHLWRAVETITADYYLALTGTSFDQDGTTPNWGARIKKLRDKGADPSITAFLDHIREHYRNPQTHPNEMVEINEAQLLFGMAFSVIAQLVMATLKLKNVSGSLKLVQPPP